MAIKRKADSIVSQKYITHDYLDAQDDIIFVRDYDDDGKTGTDFDRPAFSGNDGRHKKWPVNCIIVKDLSRLGRNYILVGQYLE